MSPFVRSACRFVVAPAMIAALSVIPACESAEQRSDEVFVVDYAPLTVETETTCGEVETRRLEQFTLGRGGRIVERLVEDFDAEGAVGAAERLTYAHDALGRITRVDAWTGSPADPADGRRWRLTSTKYRAWTGDAMTAERELRYVAPSAGQSAAEVAVEHVRTLVRGADGRLTAIEHAIHDSAGRRTATSTTKTNSAGRLTELSLDDANRLVWTRDGQGRVTREARTSGGTTLTESFTYTGDYVTTWRRACVSETKAEDCGWTETYACTPTTDGQGMLTSAVCTGQDWAGCAVTRTLAYTRAGRSASVDLAPEGWPTHRTELLLRDATDLARIAEP